MHTQQWNSPVGCTSALDLETLCPNIVENIVTSVENPSDLDCLVLWVHGASGFSTPFPRLPNTAQYGHVPFDT